ncbi:unnamed protein product [Prorocentrum cordatum]|uniref:Protein RFT1 homolog n=1 Tax=Prorocentrum cordatum TaxID=2364126 RepID=A0ABN9QFR4_9DINO|nr:unnamed protein product [Polarella glacialis]
MALPEGPGPHSLAECHDAAVDGSSRQTTGVQFRESSLPRDSGVASNVPRRQRQSRVSRHMSIARQSVKTRARTTQLEYVQAFIERFEEEDAAAASRSYVQKFAGSVVLVSSPVACALVTVCFQLAWKESPGFFLFPPLLISSLALMLVYVVVLVLTCGVAEAELLFDRRYLRGASFGCVCGACLLLQNIAFGNGMSSTLYNVIRSSDMLWTLAIESTALGKRPGATKACACLAVLMLSISYIMADVESTQDDSFSFNALPFVAAVLSSVFAALTGLTAQVQGRSFTKDYSNKLGAVIRMLFVQQFWLTVVFTASVLPSIGDIMAQGFFHKWTFRSPCLIVLPMMVKAFVSNLAIFFSGALNKNISGSFTTGASYLMECGLGLAVLSVSRACMIASLVSVLALIAINYWVVETSMRDSERKVVEAIRGACSGRPSAPTSTREPASSVTSPGPVPTKPTPDTVTSTIDGSESRINVSC